MAIRVRIVEGKVIAICAAISESKEGDLYLDDNVHHALTTKFSLDFTWEKKVGSDSLKQARRKVGKKVLKELIEESYADETLIPLILQEQNGMIV